MAETAILLVIKKISIVVAGEVLHLAKPLFAKKSGLVAALPTNMEFIKEELEMVHAFLKKISTRECSDIVSETWITQVRRLAYDIEDIVDQFIYIVAEHQGKGFLSNFKKVIKRPQSLFSLDVMAIEVEKMKQRLRELSSRRDRWIQAKVSGIDVEIPNYENRQEAYQFRHCQSDNDDDFVGVDKYRELLNKLLYSEDCSLRIIAVCGMGGLGKSSLVHNAYKSERSPFECRAWISVSQSCEVDDILRNMLKQLCGNDNKIQSKVAKMKNDKLRVELKKFLEKKRYMIVLDDVWRGAVALEIRNLLLNSGTRSRVVITTRIDEVASVAEDACKIELEPLNKHDAWILFSRKVFWKIENQVCPPELQEWGEKIVKRCAGLPLALVALGSLLSLRDKSEAEWKSFYSKITCELHNNPDINHVEWILNLSYRHLPYYLQNCFLYCAMFPEGHLLKRKKLIRLWIAEGFIEQRGTISLEEVAESYLIELVHRSMLQVVARNSFGRIRRLRMHDLVRELAIKLSEKECFSSVYDDTSGVIKIVSDSRRMSVLRCETAIRLTMDSSRLRTLLAFDRTMLHCSWSHYIPSKSKYLAVLDLSGLPIETICHSIGELFNLKYLCLNDTNVKSLPKTINRLQSLETLSLERTQLITFPPGFAELKKLRHVLVWKLIDTAQSSFSQSLGVRTNEGLWNLKELQTLDEVRANEKFISKMGNLTQLRSLYISDVRSKYCSQLCSSTSKMQHLVRLHVKAINQDEILSLESLALPPQLQTLELSGRLAEAVVQSPFFSAHANTLVRLSLCWCNFAENPIPHISKLSNLTSLRLRKAYTGQQIGFSAGWFPKLKGMALVDMAYVRQIYIEEGSLINLEYLNLNGFNELADVPDGIEFLPSIQKILFSSMHPDFRVSLQESARMGRLKHVHVMYRQ
ncbi:disease resistance protein RPM1-like [Lolium rigidum]|uniref:disease resistance protein RPM1-like n=1 Tax=Lolium rigidum TaxID=89674 RepID=UPI001F5D55E0|nr:disease resistance protein RPM1-like [Lolium rigidum]